MQLLRVFPLALLLASGNDPLGAETLYDQDGVQLSATARVIDTGAATCRIREERHTAEQYEKPKANHGQPLSVWRVELVAANYSGKALDYLSAHLQVDSAWPPCDNWDGLGNYGKQVVWTGPLMAIRDVGSVQPGEERREIEFVLVWHEEEPALGRWDINYDFAVDGASGAQAGDVPPAEWPEAPTGSETRRERTPRRVEREQDRTCIAFVDNWGDHDAQGTETTWTGDCIDGLANGDGRENFSNIWGAMLSEGSYVRGKRNGYWTERATEDHAGHVFTGSYSDGKRVGHWIERWPTRNLDGEFWGEIGGVLEGPYVDGEKHGRWTRRWASGGVSTECYSRGEKIGC